MDDLVTSTEESIRSRALLREGQGFLVGTSGGLDSMVLLHVVHRLSARHRWSIVAAHFNHKIRGKAADADEAFVRRVCGNLKISFCRGEGDVRQHARENGLSIEMAARELRHRFLAQSARQQDMNTVATGHHVDDQIELFLLRLLRGGGGRGLAGMKWTNASPADAGIELIRPFLNQTKAALRRHAEAEAIAFREDASNRSNDILRNRVRNLVLPCLERCQPAFQAGILRTMEIVGMDNEFSRLAAQEWLTRPRRTSFENLHPAVQRQVVQLQLIGLGVRPGFDLVEALRAPSQPIVAATSDTHIHRDSEGNLQIEKQQVDAFGPEEVAISIRDASGEVQFKGLKLRWRRLPKSAVAKIRRPSTPQCEWFDSGRVGDSVILRHWRPGDRFHPIGMSNSVKLQNFLTNQKIPKEKRRRLIVAATADGEIFWVEGLRIGEQFRLDRHTRRVLRWSWARY